MSRPRRTPEAAAYIGVSKSFLNKDRAKGGAGRVPYRRAGRAVLYDEPDLDAYKASTRVEPKREQGAGVAETTTPLTAKGPSGKGAGRGRARVMSGVASR
jgi:hypothetical protein